ncbi:Xaa-Pro peptidase family protein [Shinella sp.]|uniref:M24 family metallopeptidase n=1 Tax=Shinella sp. TaxID=1870904 RepID=UPI00258A052B|nr:Xaa-Pro peptidase family protein [Shinella sp.]MCW5712288.1 aminopeptidase P family protein [Shinella sp.]
MSHSYKARTEALQQALAEKNLAAAIISDPDSVAYFAGYWNYLGVEFGRPTLLIVGRDTPPVLLTPLMESEMCGRMTWIQDIRPWTDGNDEWRKPLEGIFSELPQGPVGIEGRAIPSLVREGLARLRTVRPLEDISFLIARQRMIKSAAEIETMRQAGQVAIAMMDAARQTIAEGVSEYEITLAAMAAGTRRAATFLRDPDDRFVSPVIQNVQVLQSGSDTCMVHRRASTRRLSKGDPVYLCFCGMVSFRGYKLGFDREFYVGRATDEQLKVQGVAIAAQKAALATIRPGIACEEVNAAAEAVYRDAGHLPGYRTGRSVGMSLLESPELKRGERTLLQPGMTFAVDGGITVAGAFGGRIGDSIVVTETGFEYLTPYPNEIAVLP